MKNKQLLALALIGYAAYNLMKPRQIYVPVAQPQGNPNTNYLAWVQYAQSALSAASGLYTTISDLWKPGGPFYQTPVPEWQADSPFWNDVNSNVAGIGRTYSFGESKNVPAFWCNDGKVLSYPYAPGMCSYHGGVNYDRANAQAAQRAYHKRMQRLRNTSR